MFWLESGSDALSLCHIASCNIPTSVTQAVKDQSLQQEKVKIDFMIYCAEIPVMVTGLCECRGSLITSQIQKPLTNTYYLTVLYFLAYFYFYTVSYFQQRSFPSVFTRHYISRAINVNVEHMLGAETFTSPYSSEDVKNVFHLTSLKIKKKWGLRQHTSSRLLAQQTPKGNLWKLGLWNKYTPTNSHGSKHVDRH